MRVAILSDIHGNLTAFEAVLADIKQVSPDLVLHGGDFADNGSSPTEIIDQIRALGWQGVMGNTDEMLVEPESLENFASQSSAPAALWETIRQIASATRSILGDERLAWLRELPRVQTQKTFALVHATPQSCWRAPSPEATDKDLDATYASPGPANRRLRAHSSSIDSQHVRSRETPHQHGKRRPPLRRRSSRIVSAT